MEGRKGGERDEGNSGERWMVGERKRWIGVMEEIGHAVVKLEWRGRKRRARGWL